MKGEMKMFNANTFKVFIETKGRKNDVNKSWVAEKVYLTKEEAERFYNYCEKELNISRRFIEKDRYSEEEIKWAQVDYEYEPEFGDILAIGKNW